MVPQLHLAVLAERRDRVVEVTHPAATCHTHRWTGAHYRYHSYQKTERLHQVVLGPKLKPPGPALLDLGLSRECCTRPALQSG